MAGLTLRMIVGLGNPGPEHQLTRHNAGFWFVDLLARRHGGEFRDYRKYSGELARVTIAERELMLLKPTTYMNRSGLSVRQLSDFFKVPPEEILVVYDELLQKGGGHGGHNGLRDVIAHLGDGFWRMRIGIGHPGNRTEVIDYVLTRAPRAERPLARPPRRASARAARGDPAARRRDGGAGWPRSGTRARTRDPRRDRGRDRT